MKFVWIPLIVLTSPFMLLGGLAWLILILIYPFISPYMMYHYGKVLPFWVYGSWDLDERDWKKLSKSD